MNTVLSVKSVGVVGSGLMGRGIAECFARSNMNVVLVKATPGDPQAILTKIVTSLDKQVRKGKLTEDAKQEALSHLVVTDDWNKLSQCDVVIESIIEDIKAKRELFQRVKNIVKPEAVFATNTSTLKISAIAEGILDNRLIAMHFFSPAATMPLVEIAWCDGTPDAIIATAKQCLKAANKSVVEVSDSTGFIVNRLLVPYLLGAMRALSSGLAGAKEIDQAMQLGCGHPMGPLALSDFIGLDVVYAMAKLLSLEFGDGCYTPPGILRRLVQQGHLGRKSRLGFYDYSERPPQVNSDVTAVCSVELSREAA